MAILFLFVVFLLTWTNGASSSYAINSTGPLTAGRHGYTFPTPDDLLCSTANYCTSPTCPNGTIQMSGTLHPLMGNSSGEIQLRQTVREMMIAVETFGPITNPSIGGLHLSFQYLCCYSEIELANIAKVLASVRWSPIPVSFTRVVCAAGEFTLLANPAAQGNLFAVVSAFEEAMAEAGYPVHRFRAEQFAFHVSLFQPPHGALANGTLTQMLAAAQATVPVSSEEIIVDSFQGFGRTFNATATKS
eukprot:m.95318 g.95318  ORF g.95318 m.95318 type:complete len:246 (-) comp26809_c0_seq1:56-793(-)